MEGDPFFPPSFRTGIWANANSVPLKRDTQDIQKRIVAKNRPLKLASQVMFIFCASECQLGYIGRTKDKHNFRRQFGNPS